MIGAGYFIGASAALSLGGPAVLLSYALAGTLVFLVNLMMRDLALKVPGRASFLRQIQYALGNRAAFVAGWAYWLTWIIAIAVEVIAVATMLAPYIPLPYAVLEILIMALMTGVNLMSVKGYGEFEYWFSAIKVLAIVCFIGIGVWALLSRPIPVHDNLFAHGGLLPHGWLALLAVIPTILFSMGAAKFPPSRPLNPTTPSRTSSAPRAPSRCGSAGSISSPSRSCCVWCRGAMSCPAIRRSCSCCTGCMSRSRMWRWRSWS